MARMFHPLHGVLICSLLAASVTVASAHCCHDERTIGVAEESGGLRPGLHGPGGGLTDESVQSDPPSTGGGLRGAPESLGNGGTGSLGSGGVGQLHGNSLGSYGAGSIGEPGPGGLGSMRDGGLGPQAPRTH